MDQLVFTLALAWGLSNAPLDPVLRALGDEECVVREAAHHRLDRALGPDTNRVTVMMWRAHAGHPDLEVRRRVKKVMSRHHDKVLTALRPTDYLLSPSIYYLPD